MSDNSPLYTESFAVGPLQCNCTIVADLVQKKAIVIDPGGNPEIIIAKLKAKDLALVKVIHTHAHFDHFLASAQIKQRTGAPLGLHKDDKFLWDNLETQCKMFGFPFTPTPPPDFFLSDGADISLPSCQAIALHTPGHTPGSMSFLFEDLNLLIAGDTLFKEGIGRTDLWGGNYEQIEFSIKNIIYKLQDDTTVITGHGPSTKIGHEKNYNPFIRI